MAGSVAAPGDHELSAGRYRASVDEIGATLRSLTYDGRDLVAPYPAGTVRPLYRGATIAPWPNRIRDGRYRFDDQNFQASINEVDRGHALHGLVQWIRFAVTVVAPDRITLQHDLVPQDGYPFPLRLTVTFRLAADGLVTTLTAVNTGTAPAPYGCCPHPYLVAGAGPVDDWTLQMPADLRLEVDDRLIPTATADVATVDNDFRAGAPIGGREIDHAFTGLGRDAAGRTAIEVLDPTGNGVRMSFGQWAPWVQIHTADRPEPQWNRSGLAVEPMSCPPNAFNTGTDLVVLSPGEHHEAEWVLSAVDVAD
jgi:aldose 1-epimerase